MTVYYDYKKIIPGGWNPPNNKKHICKFCNKSVYPDESEIYKKYKCCVNCYKRIKDYVD